MDNTSIELIKALSEIGRLSRELHLSQQVGDAAEDVLLVILLNLKRDLTPTQGARA